MALFGGKKENNNNSPGDLPPGGMPPPDMNQQGIPQDPNMQMPPPDMNSPNMPPPDMMGQQDMGNMPDMNQQGIPQDPNMQMPPPDAGYPNFPQPDFSQPAPQSDVKERVEEIAEAIIDEKWNELAKDINKVVEWKERTDGELKKIQQEVANLKERFDSLHKGVLGKITEYDQNLTTVGSEIKAMEMAFQKILPNFIDNINKLDRIVKGSSSGKK
jgi:hypothetical protein